METKNIDKLNIFNANIRCRLLMQLNTTRSPVKHLRDSKNKSMIKYIKIHFKTTNYAAHDMRLKTPNPLCKIM